MVFLTTGCFNFNIFDDESDEIDEFVCYYNNTEYVTEDNYGRRIEGTWCLPEVSTHKVKVFFGYRNEQNQKPNRRASVYDDERLNMFIYFNYILYAKKGYVFPDYQDNFKIEKIIICRDDVESFFDEECKEITDEVQIEKIRQLLITAHDGKISDPSYHAEQYQTTDYSIGIKYENFPAIFYYGCISTDVNGNLGIYCADNNTQNYIYEISDDIVEILKGKLV